MRLRYLSEMASAAVLCSCSCELREETADGSGAEGMEVYSALELPLPDVPSTLTEPVERADYIMTHFGGGMDVSDMPCSRNRVFMEMNLVNFMPLFPHGSERASSRSMGGLLGWMAKDSVAFRLVADLMERYLENPDSPMRNEAFYILYLEEPSNVSP